MHESSLAKDILTQMLRRAADAGASKVQSVSGWIAETEQLQPDSLNFHFQAHAKGTPAEGATLNLRLIHVKARCKSCGTEYLPEHHVTLCPKCNSVDGELLGETGVCIEAINVE